VQPAKCRHLEEIVKRTQRIQQPRPLSALDSVG